MACAFSTLNYLYAISWQFYCQDGDIAFSICHKKELGTETIVPRERVDCCTSAEEGEIVCTNCGDCEFHLLSYSLDVRNLLCVLFRNQMWSSSIIRIAIFAQRRFGLPLR